jgi:hypothetical protein
LELRNGDFALSDDVLARSDDALPRSDGDPEGEEIAR